MKSRVLPAALVVIAAIVAVIALSAGDDADKRLPEAGSRFGATESAARPGKGLALLEALAPVLAPRMGGDGARPEGLDAPVGRAVARLFLVGFPGTGPDRRVLGRLGQREWGGIVLEAGNVRTEGQVKAMVDRVRRAAARARHTPPLVASIQSGGDLGAIPGAPPLQARAADERAARAEAATAGRRLRGLGVRLVLAPIADVGTAGGPWAGRAFSDDAVVAARLTAGAVAGWKDAHVASAAGHFPGEGAASRDPAQGTATVGLSLDELRDRDLRPFAAIVDDAPAIQLSAATYAAYDGVTPATLLPDVVQLLREDLGFKGLVISGDLAAASLASGEPVADVAVQALAAGADLLWVPGDAAAQDAAWRGVVQAVRSGEVSAARVAEALQRASLLRASYGVR